MSVISLGNNTINTTQIITTQDYEIGMVIGDVLTRIVVANRKRIKAFKFFDIDATLNPGGVGDVLSYSKMMTDPTGYELTVSNFTSTQTLNTMAITSDNLILNNCYCVPLKINALKTPFVKNSNRNKREFINLAVNTIGDWNNTRLLTLLYTGAGSDYSSTGASGSHKFLSQADYNTLSAYLWGKDVVPEECVCLISGHDMEYLRAALISDKQPLTQNNITFVTGGSEQVYNAFGLQIVPERAIPYTHAASPHADTIHNVVVNPKDVIVCTKSLMPPNAEEYAAGGITLASFVDGQTGISYLMTVEHKGNPPVEEICLYTLWGMKIVNTDSVIDVSSIKAYA